MIKLYFNKSDKKYKTITSGEKVGRILIVLILTTLIYHLFLYYYRNIKNVQDYLLFYINNVINFIKYINDMWMLICLILFIVLCFIKKIIKSQLEK